MALDKQNVDFDAEAGIHEMAYQHCTQHVLRRAFELSSICNCQVAFIMFTPQGKLVQYSSAPMDVMLEKYCQACIQPHQIFTHEELQIAKHQGQRLRHHLSHEPAQSQRSAPHLQPARSAAAVLKRRRTPTQAPADAPGAPPRCRSALGSASSTPAQRSRLASASDLASLMAAVDHVELLALGSQQAAAPTNLAPDVESAPSEHSAGTAASSLASFRHRSFRGSNAPGGGKQMSSDALAEESGWNAEDAPSFLHERKPSGASEADEECVAGHGGDLNERGAAPERRPSAVGRVESCTSDKAHAPRSELVPVGRRGKSPACEAVSTPALGPSLLAARTPDAELLPGDLLDRPPPRDLLRGGAGAFHRVEEAGPPPRFPARALEAYLAAQV